jgi:Ca-activated chloride channel family protein
LHEYESGNFHTALDEFKQLSREKTNDFRLSYNAGTAAYRAKQFDDAQKFLGAATASPDLQLQQQAFYNLGNTLFEVGEQTEEPDVKQKAWENSAKSFENSLKLNPQDADAKNNLEFVKKKLEELKQQQQQQQNQQSKNDQSKENKEKQDNKDQQQNQDQQKQNQNQDSEQKDSEKDEQSQQQDSAKQDQQEKESQQKQEQAKNDQQNQQKQNGKEQNSEEQQGEEQQSAVAAAAGQMTPEQARQFLDAQKQEDKALIFAPAKDPKQINRKLKDW